MSAQVRALVALDSGVDRQTIESILPYDASITVVGVVDGLEESWTTMQETPTDLLVVGIADSSDRALFFIDGAVKERPDRPVVVLATSRSNGFIRRAFEAGADDIVILPESQEHVRFTLEKAIARKRGTASALGIAVAPMVCVLGRKPDILVPSDREIPRSVNEGDPIVVAKPRVEAARAFRELAALYAGSVAPASVATHQNGSGPGSRLSALLSRSR